MNEDIVWIREELEKNQENLCDRTMLNSYRSDFNSSTLQHVADVHLSETSRNDQEVVESCLAHIGNYSIVNEENESDLCPSAADEFNISEYERNLQKNTKETMNLVKNLCDRSDNLKEQQRSILMKLNEEHLERCKAMDEIQKINEINAKLCEERNELKNEVLNKQTSRASRKDSDQINLQRIEWHSIDSARLGDCYLVEPIGGMILPNFNVLISDHQAGLFVFSIDSQFIRKVTNADWKWPQAVALWDQNKILVSAMCKMNDSGDWKRFILKFDEDLNYINKIEGPKWIEDVTVSRNRLCCASNGYIYFLVSDSVFSAIYELSPHGKWTELYYKKGQRLADIQVLAVIGPVLEILVVDEQRGYVWMFSIRESEICGRKLLAIVEKPGAICIDQNAHLFVQDIGQGKIRLVNTAGNFEVIADVALADKHLYAMSANKGFLLVTYRETNVVRLHKYKSIK